MRRMTTRRIVIVGATVGAVLLTGGVAFAFWSSTGTTAGAAEVAPSVTDQLVVEQTGVDPTDLRPGGTPQVITAKVDNPSGTDVFLTDVTVTVADVIEAAGVTDVCELDDFAIADNTDYDGELIVAGGTSGDEGVATIQLEETGVNQDACKGASVVLSLTAS
jgi:hypothetical protein